MPFGMGRAGWVIWPYFTQWFSWWYPFGSLYASSCTDVQGTRGGSLYSPASKEEEIELLQEEAKKLKQEYDRIKALVAGIGLDTETSGVDPGLVWEAMKRDKKFIHGRNRFVLLEEIGKARVVEDVDPEVLAQALKAHSGDRV